MKVRVIFFFTHSGGYNISVHTYIVALLSTVAKKNVVDKNQRIFLKKRRSSQLLFMVEIGATLSSFFGGGSKYSSGCLLFGGRALLK